MLASLVAALKFDSVNPVPDMTKRKTASKPITRGSWPSVSKSILNLPLTRSTTSLKELSLYITSVLYRLVAMRKATFFLPQNSFHKNQRESHHAIWWLFLYLNKKWKIKSSPFLYIIRPHYWVIIKLQNKGVTYVFN